jgi:hypothetical protein
MKYITKQTYLKKDFWRDSLMKLLDLLEHEELTQHRALWQNYDISNHDEKLISKEYNKYLKTVKKL